MSRQHGEAYSTFNNIQGNFVLLVFGQYELFSGGLRIFKDPFWLWVWESNSFVKKEREDT